MTHKPYLENRSDAKPVVIGPRVSHEIRRRIKELEQRIPSAMTSSDRRELRKLKGMLALLSTVEGGGQ